MKTAANEPAKMYAKLTKGDSGMDVMALQTTLMNLGCPLPKWGADGSLGSESLLAASLLLEQHGKKFNADKSSLSSKELSFIYGLKAKHQDVPMPSNLYDIRKTAGRMHVTARRSWKDVTGICLHQTACVLGERARRWDNVGCHVGITRKGKKIWIHEFDWRVVHGNGWNAQTVGIEIDGQYEGVEGDLKTFWRPKSKPHLKPNKLSTASIDATMEAIVWICNEVEAHGGRVKVLVAHRQSSSTRRSDPGSAIWQRIALPMHADLGLKLKDGGKGFKIGKGRPIPEAWNPKYKGIKY